MIFGKPKPKPSLARAPLDEEAQNRAMLADAEARLAHGRLGARCLLKDGQEFACIARNITMAQVEIHVRRTIEPETTVVLYLDVLGLVHGRVGRQVPGGYMVSLNIARERRAEFAERLGNAAFSPDAPEERIAPRIVPNERKVSIRMPNDHRIIGEIVDISTSGLAIRMSPKPGVGVLLVVGAKGRFATVVRHTPDGIAAQFNAPLNGDEFGPDIKL